MEINNRVNYKSYKDSIQDIDMGLDVNNTDSIMTLLRNSIYSNPLESFVREIYSNAIDAHLKSNINTPIQVSLKLNLEEDAYEFIVRDFGSSMTIEDFKNVYAKMGSSTKTSSNKEMGGWGLGAKSPLAYTNQFFIDTFTKEGEASFHREWVQYIDSSQVGKISLLKEENYVGTTGTQIRIPIQLKDYNNIIVCINKYLSYSVLPFETNGFEFVDARPNLNVIGEGWGFIDQGRGYYYRYNPYQPATIIISGIPYKIDKKALHTNLDNNNYEALIRSKLKNNSRIRNDLELFNNFLIATLHLNYVLIADIGSVDLSASREDLQYTEKTCCYLYTKLFDMFQEYCTHLEIDYVYNPNFLKACHLFAIKSSSVIQENVLTKLVWAKENCSFSNNPFLFKTGWGNEIKEYYLYEQGNSWQGNKQKVLRSDEISKVNLDYRTNKILFVLQDTTYVNYTRFIKDYLIRVVSDDHIVFVVEEKDKANLCSWVLESTDMIKMSDMVSSYKEWKKLNKTSTTKKKRDASIFNAYEYVGREERDRAEGFAKYFVKSKAPTEPTKKHYYLLNEEMDALKDYNIELPIDNGYGSFSVSKTINNYLIYKGIEKNQLWFNSKRSRAFDNENWISFAQIIKEDFKNINRTELKQYAQKVFISKRIPSIAPVFSTLEPGFLDNSSLYSKLSNKFFQYTTLIKESSFKDESIAQLTIEGFRKLFNAGNTIVSNYVNFLDHSLIDINDPNLIIYKEFMKDYPLLSMIGYYESYAGCKSKDNFRDYIQGRSFVLKDSNKKITFDTDASEGESKSEFKLMMEYYS